MRSRTVGRAPGRVVGAIVAALLDGTDLLADQQHGVAEAVDFAPGS